MSYISDAANALRSALGHCFAAYGDHRIVRTDLTAPMHEVAYVDRYGVTCPIALFPVCPPEEGPDEPEGLWWLRSISYPTSAGESLHKMLVESAACWLRRRPCVISS